MNLKFVLKLVLLLFLVFISSTLILLYTGYSAALKQDSFLPYNNLFSDLATPDSLGSKSIEISNHWYMLKATESGNISIKNQMGETILSALSYYSKYEDTQEFKKLKNIKLNLLNDSTITISGNNSEYALINMTFIVYNFLPKLDVQVNTKYNSEVIIEREAIVAKFDVPLTEVYKKNGQIDNNKFDEEYWLQRQGVRFGNGAKSSLIYNTPNISSLQLNTLANILCINLDFYLDHPHVHVPFQEDAKGRWEDQSNSIYKAGEVRNNSFSMYFNKLPKATPRLMSVPKGNLSAYVFTEHADGDNIRSHRAAYFGSEGITNAKDATGGFVGHKIPTTKSVFYVDSIGVISETSALNLTVKKELKEFLDQLDSIGIYDICLHSPENFNSSRKVLEESIEYMKKNFETSTWIDHGMYNGLINREAFICDGLDTNSKFYAADLWEEFDTRYFWNPVVEFIKSPKTVILKKELKHFRFYNASVHLWMRSFSSKELEDTGFMKALFELRSRYPIKVEMNSFAPNMGNAYPTPLMWKHPTRTRSFYSWTTDHTKFYRDGFLDRTDKQVFNNEQKQLDLLLNNWGVFIEHGYYIRISKHDVDILEKEKDGAFVINPVFDKFLALLADLRDKGDVNVTTIRDLLDYWVLLNNISFEYLPDGEIQIYNKNDKAIQGLSLAIQAENAYINGETPAFRRVNDDIIIWFDMPAKAEIKLTIMN